ncbi:MAG: YtxH domain-containing protein [Anaerolineae bacterium]|jgi:gas vesicle protein|nr:YtxH domain-containing protein [Chloroflexota bacterium]
MKHEGGGADFIAGFFAGTLVGAALALLFAPTSGEETRQQLIDKGIELRQRAGEWDLDPSRLNELRARGEGFLEEQRARVADAVQEGKLAAERRKEELLRQFQPPKDSDQAIDLTS